MEYRCHKLYFIMWPKTLLGQNRGWNFQRGTFDISNWPVGEAMVL